MYPLSTLGVPFSFPLRTRFIRTCLALLLAPIAANAQFDLQHSNTTASLRGIAAPGNGVAWASGTDGTVLRTEDGGFVWQGCAMPPGAEKLDFRGVQAFDAQTALVMSSGKGDLSRVYKTTDGCRTWIRVSPSADADSFFDTLIALSPTSVIVLGDSMKNRYQLLAGRFSGDMSGWTDPTLSEKPLAGEASFAASNSALVRVPSSSEEAKNYFWFAAQVPEKSLVHRLDFKSWTDFATFTTPMAQPTASAGIFSLAFRTSSVGVAVGGDYAKPANATQTAAFSKNAGATWKLAMHAPHGYRSSVAYDAGSKTWITVGPNGTDISRDDGRNWSPLLPGKNDAPDVDKQWNALALPFVVGPHGRIGRLRGGVLKTQGAAINSVR